MASLPSGGPEYVPYADFGLGWCTRTAVYQFGRSIVCFQEMTGGDRSERPTITLN